VWFLNGPVTTSLRCDTQHSTDILHKEESDISPGICVRYQIKEQPNHTVKNNIYHLNPKTV
jgi:hypothetical protein